MSISSEPPEAPDPQLGHGTSLFPSREIPPSEDRRKVAILANPFSGTGPTAARVHHLQRALEVRGIESIVIWDPLERRDFLQQGDAKGNVRCVVAVGGDGTVGDVVNEMRGEIPLATLPCGNENLFAQEFAFPSDPDRLADGIASGKMRRWDVAQAGGRKFTLMLGAGFDADVTHRVAAWRNAKDKLHRIRRISYLLPILNSLRHYNYPTLQIEADGRCEQGCHLYVFNASRYAMGIPFAREARPDDGTLEWILFQRGGIWHLALYFFAVLFRRHHQRADVTWGTARAIQVRSEVAVPIQMDGEAGGRTPVDIRILPAALVLVDMG